MKPAGIPADEKRLNLVVGQRYIQIFDAADQGAVLNIDDLFVLQFTEFHSYHLFSVYAAGGFLCKRSNRLLKNRKGSEILFQTLQRAFFQARHLSLGNSQFRGDFCLRLALIVALVDNLGFLIA